MARLSERTLVTVALLSAMFLTAVSTTIVATAAPSITQTLEGLALYSWVFSAYLLSMTVTTPLYGKLADLHGRKPIYLLGVGLFVGGSLLCGLATSMEQLILFRFVQGIGAGAIHPIALTLAGDLFPLAQRARMQGLFAAMWGLASLTGPPLGGFLVAGLGWRWVFWAMVPLGLASALLMAYALHEGVAQRRHQLDWWGAAAVAGGVSAFLLALFEIDGTVAGSPLGAGPLLLLAVALLAFFLWWETRVAEPLVPLGLFRMRVVGVGGALNFITGAAVLGSTSYGSLFLQGVLGTTPVQAGLLLLPFDIAWIMGSFLSPRVIVRYGYRTTVFLGMCVSTVGTLATSRLEAEVPPVVFALVLGTCGLGFGCILSPLTIAVQNAVDWSQRGVATATSVFFRTIGGTVGMAVLGVALNLQLLAALGTADEGRGARVEAVTQLLDPVQRAALAPATEVMLRQALAQGLQAVYLLMALAALVGVAVVLLLPGGRPEEQDRAPAATAEPPGAPVGSAPSVGRNAQSGERSARPPTAQQ